MIIMAQIARGKRGGGPSLRYMPPLATEPEPEPETEPESKPEVPELSYDIIGKILGYVEEAQDPWRSWRIAEIRKIRAIVDQ